MAQASWQVDFGVVDWRELAFEGTEHVAVNFVAADFRVASAVHFTEVLAVADFTAAASPLSAMPRAIGLVDSAKKISNETPVTEISRCNLVQARTHDARNKSFRLRNKQRKGIEGGLCAIPEDSEV
jgi:hypothetical protein